MDSIQEGVGQSQILPLLKKISSEGIEVTLISFEKNQEIFELREQLSNSKINWKPQIFGGHGLIPGAQRLSKLISSVEDFDLIHARSDIPASAASLSRRDIPFLWDVRSLWAQQRYETSSKGIYPHVKLLIGSRFERMSAKNCSAFSTLTTSVVPVLRNRYPNLPSLSETNPTVVDLDFFSLKPRLHSNVVCLIVGTMGDFYDLNQTNFILSKLSAIIPMKIVWARPRESSTQLSSLIVDEVVELTREQMPKAIGNATFGIALSKKSMGLSAKAVSPTKVAEFFATGRPVLVSAGIGDLDSQIEEFNAGVVLKGHESVEEIAEALNVLISDDNTSVRCRALAEKYYSLDKSVTKYLKLYEGILKQ